MSVIARQSACGYSTPAFHLAVSLVLADHKFSSPNLFATCEDGRASHTTLGVRVMLERSCGLCVRFINGLQHAFRSQCEFGPGAADDDEQDDGVKVDHPWSVNGVGLRSPGVSG